MTDESKSWLSRLKSGLSKTSSKLASGITDLFTKRKLDQESLDQLEEILLTGDLGVDTTQKLIQELAKNKFDKEVTPTEIKEALCQSITQQLEPYAQPLPFNPLLRPQILLFCGVNGNGKTTTIGKLAKLYKEHGKKVMIAACDTFRAAAIDQLAVWAERADCPLIAGTENSDPASVAYRAVNEAVQENADILLIDTAGRLQNKTNLMYELQKICNVIKKLDESAPHNVIMVIDATTGQNALSQVKIFKEMISVNGLIITKLDGSAKAGIVLALVNAFNLPIHFIGVGESIADLNVFSARPFAENLVGL